MAGQQQVRHSETRPHAFFRAYQCGRGEDENRKRRYAEKAKQMHRLHHDRDGHDAVANRVPGKAGGQEAAQPF